MSFTFLKKEDFPTEKGQRATEPKVSINEACQMTFNSFLVENYVKENTHAFVAVDGSKLGIVFAADGNIPKICKGMSLSDAWKLNRAKDKETGVLSKTATISLAGPFKANGIEIAESTRLKGVVTVDKNGMVLVDLDELEVSKVEAREPKKETSKETVKETPKETAKPVIETEEEEEEEDID